ncbi:germinal-center associated nuclear protein-like isoform X2 [Patiria miniata]|uniref:Germinal-center associated nuclear protein n=1 Tax=Patiria miniata TaxID=46514 RepID=A0A913ZK81_PATMI|nr:germinal-center associated nuclear protein-like isoform X2 [Patiria miniata]
MEVRSSEPVKFALKAFSAVSSNNYVKFYKLLRSTTYLNACIMHRYFMQVRNMALDVMNKAYTVSQTRGSRFPLAKITTTLAFDNQSQALEFCLSHNLAVEDEMIQFSRAAFQHPDITPSPERSLRIIEAKNTMTIGEVVNGGPLPPDVLHKASSSFDENGLYKGYTVVTTETAAPESKDVVPEKAELAESILKPADDQIMTVPTSIPTAVPQIATKVLYPSTEIKEAARGLFLEVIDEMVRDLSNSFLGWLRLIQVGSVEILHSTIERVVLPSIREIAQGVIDQEQHRHQETQIAEMNRRRLEQQAREEERQRQIMMERKERLERTVTNVMEETVDEVVDEQSRMISAAEIRAVEQQLKQECIERATSELHHELIEEVLMSECHHVAAEVIQSETELRDQRLAESERAVLMAQTARYLQRWYRVYTKRIHLKRTLLTFPAAPPNQTAAEQLKVLWAGRTERSEVTEGHHRRDVTLDSPFGIVTGRESIARSILKVHYLKNLRQQQAWSPLDLPSMLSNSFHSHHASGQAGKRQQHHYWKLVASLPSGRSHDKKVLCDWLTAKLQRGRISEGIRKKQLEDNSQVETLSLYSSKVPHISPSQLCTLSICTKVMAGSLDLTHQPQTRHQLLGTSGILFGLDQPSQDQNYWQQAKSRLDSILQAKPTSPPPPVVIALLDWPATEHAQSMCVERLGLHRLSQMGLVSSYCFMQLNGDVEDPVNNQELGECLEWLASRCAQPPQLSEDSLKGYLDTGMTEFFSLPLHEDARTRRDAGLPEQGCHHVIDLYNATVRHLADVASSSTLTSLSWPPTEFTKTDNQTELPDPDWNASDTMQLLRDRMLSLILPALPLVHEDDEWQRVCDLCHGYLATIPGSHRGKAPLFARVQRLLEKCRRSFEDTCYLAYDAPGCEPMAGHVPWTRIIQECIDYVMSTVQSHDLNGDEGKQMTVYYIQSEFDSFKIPQTWKEALHTTTEDSFLQPPRFASQVAAVVQQKQTEFMERQLEATMIEMKDIRKPAVSVLDREPLYAVDAKESAQAVKTVLSSAKEESKMFDDLLQQWLHGTNEMTSQDGRTETDSSSKSPASPPRLEQSLQDLTLAMESERQAARLTELRLASLLSL